jgi:hypothetical protein
MLTLYPSGCSQVKTNIGKPIKLYFKVYQYENKSDISESPSLVKIHLRLIFKGSDCHKGWKEKKYLGLLQDDNSASHRYGALGFPSQINFSLNGQQTSNKECYEGSDFFAINFKRGNVKQNIDYTADPLLVGVLPLKYFQKKVLIVEDNKINMF